MGTASMGWYLDQEPGLPLRTGSFVFFDLPGPTMSHTQSPALAPGIKWNWPWVQIRVNSMEQEVAQQPTALLVTLFHLPPPPPRPGGYDMKVAI